MKKTLFRPAAVLLVFCAALLLAGSAVSETDVFEFDRTVNTVFEGETLQTVLNRGGRAAEGAVSYESGEPSQATVGSDGVVTGIKKGRVTITATVTNGQKRFRTSMTVTVLRRVESITLDAEKHNLWSVDDPRLENIFPSDTPGPVMTLPVKHRVTLRPDVQPAGASDRGVIITSSDTTVASVSENTVTARAGGTCVITIASRQNPEVSFSFDLVVTEPVQHVSVSGPSESLWVGDTVSLEASCLPATATIRTVTWRSLDEKIAVVGSDGVVTAVGKGQTRIRATAADGSGQSSDHIIKVRQQPTEITLNQSSLRLPVKNRRTLQATVLPRNADDRSIQWTSSNSAIASVGADGRITAVSPGVCTVTASSKSFPEVSASCEVSVYQPVTGITFKPRSLTCNVKESVQVRWQVAPDTATDPGVVLSSANEKIATVDQDGTIHGLKRGTVNIIATARDGSGVRGYVKVDVLQPVTGVHLKNDTVRVGVRETLRLTAVLEPADASNHHMTWTSADPSIVTVKGTGNVATLTGRAWGTTTVTGVTEDGGFTVTATVKGGNLNRALIIDDLYLRNNKIKINVRNESNMTITKFTFRIECYDLLGDPLVCAKKKATGFNGSYQHTLTPGRSTTHGLFDFERFIQPEIDIGKIVMTITGYTTDEGYHRDIKEGSRPTMVFMRGDYEGE